MPRVTLQSPLSELELSVLGRDEDPMPEVEARLAQAYPGRPVIAWEGDAATFQFQYVSRGAADILGYPVARWLHEPTFWADLVVAPDDRDNAIAYCALATASRADHVFEYRARTADGRTVVLRDVVRVIVSKRGIAERLRGLMFDVTAERTPQRQSDILQASQNPTHQQLEAQKD